MTLKMQVLEILQTSKNKYKVFAYSRIRLKIKARFTVLVFIVY